MTEFVFIEERPTEGREHRMSSGVSIGRHDCDVIVEDPEVSRRHLQLRVAGSSIAVEDLGSTHGTLVNGAQVQGIHELSAGDRIEFGATVWRLQPVTPEVPAAPEAAPAAPEAAPAAPEAAPETEPLPSEPVTEPAPPAAAAPPPRAEPPPQRQFASSASAPAAPAPSAAAPAAPAAAAPSGEFTEPRTRRGRSAARSLPATAYSYGVIGVTAAALIVYFASR